MGSGGDFRHSRSSDGIGRLDHKAQECVVNCVVLGGGAGIRALPGRVHAGADPAFFFAFLIPVIKALRIVPEKSIVLNYLNCKIDK